MKISSFLKYFDFPVFQKSCQIKNNILLNINQFVLCAIPFYSYSDTKH